ncbi:hypothetical protein VTK26DRAFT_5073 [Humicola hyalothermophila]
MNIGGGRWWAVRWPAVWDQRAPKSDGHLIRFDGVVARWDAVFGREDRRGGCCSVAKRKIPGSVFFFSFFFFSFPSKFLYEHVHLLTKIPLLLLFTTIWAALVVVLEMSHVPLVALGARQMSGFDCLFFPVTVVFRLVQRCLWHAGCLVTCLPLIRVPRRILLRRQTEE